MQYQVLVWIDGAWRDALGVTIGRDEIGMVDLVGLLEFGSVMIREYDD